MIKDLIFDGYGYNTKNSQTRRKKPEDRYTYDQVKNKDAYFGVLAPNVVLIDVDYMDQAENLLKVLKEKDVKCPVMKTTKGMHFYFKDTVGACKKKVTHWYTAGGTIVDILLSSSNGIAYLKKPGETKERDFIYGTDLTELEELPYILYPYRLAKADTFPNEVTGEKKKIGEITALFDDMGEGSRNSTLTAHILALQNAGFRVKDTIREIIRDINYYFFADPLSEVELELILRDETFDKGEKENIGAQFFDDKKFLFNKFALYLKEVHGIIKIDDELHFYNDGIYSKGHDIEKIMIEEIEGLRDSNRREVLKYLNLICEEKERTTKGLIAFNNGLYDVFNDKLLSFSKNEITTNKIPWDYNPNAFSPLMDKTLNQFACFDVEIRKLIEELIGYCLFPKNELGKAFIILGDKANGKSTFLKILIAAIGKINTSALSLNDITNSRFRLYETSGKLLNAGDDIGSEYIPEGELFRKLVTGDTVTAEQKGKNPIKFNCYAKFIFSANDIPRVKDPTGAMARRVIIIPFKNSFTVENKDYDPYFLDKITNKECIEYFIKLGIEGLKRVIKNKKFSDTEETNQLLDEFNKNNNPIIAIIEELEKIHGKEFYLEKDKNEVFNLYEACCFDEGVGTVKKSNFTKFMKKQYKLKTIDIKVYECGKVKNRYKIFKK